MTTKKATGLWITINGKRRKLEWSGVAVMTVAALEDAPRPPGLLVDLETWKPDWIKLEWFATLAAILDKHLKTHFVTSDKPITPDIANALNVRRRLTEILKCGYVTNDQRQFLPIEIAAIARTASAANTLKAKPGERRPNVDRRSTLAQAVSNERGQDDTATAWEVLDRLCGGDVVKEHKDGRVWYWNKKGKLTSVGLDRFVALFSEQRPSTG